MKKNEKTGAFTKRSAAMTAIVIVFFMGVILAYYSMLYSETRRSIIRSGELSALTSAEQIDKYLSTGIDIIRMSSYALDNMIRDKRSQAEILDYLLNQSSAIVNITSGNSPGLYGFINGEYVDGTGWTPEEGYDPTVRPWYIGPRVSIGKVAVVDPYIDLDSNTIMIALGKTLCDAKSVVSLDLSMAPLQTITQELSTQGNSEMEIVLDRKYRVIAHSDPSEVGKSYATEQGTFGSALVQGLRASDKDYFSLRYSKADYIVYSVPVSKDWICLSVCNATSAFHDLRKTLAFTVVASFLVVFVVLLMMQQAGRKDKLAQQLREHLSQAKNDIRKKEGEIGEISKVAFRDALTGVGSKAAFLQLSEELAPEIAAGKASVAVVMIDVNNLKYVNDTFGHDKGDEYLRGSCRMICETYKHSPVFRLGGDEFVAVLRDKDYEEREALAAQFNAAFEQSYAREDRSPWERYSAAAGMSIREDGDTALEQILKRADAAMYEAKQAFKAKHGSYR
jgi:diguanylate cyclase (GGDEF)-like protein